MSQSTTVVRVDDRDPTIFYSGDWYLGGNSETEFDGTTHGALTNGSTIQYTFNGTSIRFYGTVSGAPTGPPSTSSFVVDNGESVLVATSQPADPMYQYEYFASGTLEDGMHTLVVTAVDTDTVDILWFDYLEYVLGDAADTGAGGGGSSSPTPSFAFSTGMPLSSPSPSFSFSTGGPLSSQNFSSTGTALPSPSSLTTSSSASPSSPADPALSGGTTHKASDLKTVLPAVLIPVAALLLLLGALLFLWRRRQQRRRYHSPRLNILGEDPSDAPPEARFISPYASVSAPAPASESVLVSESALASESTSVLTPLSAHRPLLALATPRDSKESVVLSPYGTGVVRRSDAAGASEEGPPAYTMRS
ncbi:uncharacterized protein PHACADRAFT_213685 [Phanerochaete carnosa HHB-10118-sp]|uniref:Uncharacterized protein n=1 Tax=Phanerochaete carnosa (strain HHB-10118-sp) TaxID=650164 RepID=K5VVL9_PHACS|nr:uncharacterized protein PHACADRAFT_213685 [Phanerochaete carnosa HHB-10118-sp]EKM50825.1 hypothetical protein PHACADRAFT_213685 [Phanerochaete carnosa HHB-10118-sp]